MANRRGRKAAVASPEEVEDFTTRWNDGESLADLAAHFGCTISTASGTAHRLGLEPRKRTNGGIPRGSRLGLDGGTWMVNDRGIQVWVRDYTVA